ncbi:hypothetical protein [Acidiferrobacter thiooxydans]|uniref:hypothetical protein n=1 Tax=Acidiferrobacter thiooxydans TaxID=163359 RepID=UPI00147537FD|nr:hypothetical protein [Acidiferrobacter thiooxydans]
MAGEVIALMGDSATPGRPYGWYAWLALPAAWLALPAAWLALPAAWPVTTP